MSTNYFDNELVQSHFKQAVRARLSELETDIRAAVEHDMTYVSEHSPSVESPLEAVFVAWFSASQYPYHQYRIEKQYWLEAAGFNFRADFAVFPIAYNTKATPVIVEVDGHAFHEKTKEQVADRNQRDRALQMAGYQVLHFSFSELTSKPAWCMSEVLVAARCQFDPAFKAWVLRTNGAL